MTHADIRAHDLSLPEEVRDMLNFRRRERAMKLRDLDARLMKHNADGSSDTVQSLAEADGVLFQCPICAQGLESGTEKMSDGRERRFFRGAHYIICWFVGKVPDDLDPKPGRWTPTGTGIDDLAFVPGNPPRAISVLMTNPSGCHAHFFVRNGECVQ